ncbi:hypothetical protein RHGRI_013579 [Rhododendron griersonianum]|uniref:MULE transposase domain-containing protein n=1 Tax=Rhododendron griersonianum TaxID=479676 RepID=A0AAV6K650_9ERIC|nr:hypothetical protein RHGRI_013579 [Rhododendron griersonianum]
MTKSYSNVFVMDCTYKTNKYKMPLLDIIGVSSFNSSFYSCFAFLAKEGEGDYIWALQNFSKILGPTCHPSVIVSDRELALMNAIRVVFPSTVNLLCVWHIEKNILANYKSYFETQDNWTTFLTTWNQVISSQDEQAFNEAWKLFELLYREKEKVLCYIRKTWLPYKEWFVHAWTENCSHFGNRVSSRAEGAHAKLKQYLQVSTGDLHQVNIKICLAIDNEFNEIKAQLSRHFMASMGLPCAHKMIGWKGKVIPLDEIHTQWRIDRRYLVVPDVRETNAEEFKRLVHVLEDKYQEWPQSQKECVQQQISQLINLSVPLVLEPNILPHKGRPSGSKKGTTSTRRNASQFEIVEATRKCSICKCVGHNSRTCKEKSEANIMNSDHIVTLEDIGSNVDVLGINSLPTSLDYFLLD